MDLEKIQAVGVCPHLQRRRKLVVLPVILQGVAEAINDEPEFRWALLQDQMAFDKLHEGIKKFAEDGETLKKLLRERISA